MSGFIDNDELARVYLALVEDALASGAPPRKEVWGPEGYFFASGVEVEWRGGLCRRCGGAEAGGWCPRGRGRGRWRWGKWCG